MQTNYSTKEPLFFSIVMPTYNRAHLIGMSIESVLQQTFKSFELIVVDDGSTDDTEEVVKNFGNMQIRYFKKNNAERGAARNFGASKAQGAYINFFDSDDLMYRHHLESAKSFIDTNSRPEWFHLGYDFKGPDGAVQRNVDDFDESISKVVLFDNKLSCNGVFLRNDIAKEFSFEENRVLASSEDWELWIRLLSRFKLFYSNEITSSVISHDQRSIYTIQGDKVVARDTYFIERLRQDPVVMGHYGRFFSRFVAERYTFFMMVNAEQKNSLNVWKWAIRAFGVYPSIVVNKRFLASLKNSLLK